MSGINSQNRLFENMYILSYVFLFLTTISKLLINVSYIDNNIYFVSIVFFGMIQLFLLIVQSFNVTNLIILLLSFIGFIIGAIGYQIIVLIILIINLKFMNIKKIVYVDLIVRITVFLMICISYITGIFDKSQTIFYRSGVMRNSFGFDSPNTLANYVFYIIIIFIIFLNMNNNVFFLSLTKKISYTLFLFFIGYYFCFLVTDSRSAQVTLLIIFIGWIICLLYKKKCIKPIFGMSILLICIFLSIYIVSNFNMSNPFYYKLNDAMSYRLLFQNSGWVKYGGIHLFGNSSFTSDSIMTIDNQYIYVLLKRGLVGLLVIIYLFFVLFKNAYKKDNFFIYIVVLSLVIKSLFEATIFEFYTLLPILCLFNYDYGNKLYPFPLNKKEKREDLL